MSAIKEEIKTTTNGMVTGEDITNYIQHYGYGSGTWGTRKSILIHADVLASNLIKDEKVLVAWVGQYRDGAQAKMTSSGTTGMVFGLTNKRIIWAKKKMIGTYAKSIMLNKVNDISLRNSWAMSYLSVDTLSDGFTCILNTPKKETVQMLYNELYTQLEGLQG